MPRGSKASYSNKQRRMARHIEEGYEKRGSSSKRAERIAWATVNKDTGGAKGKKKKASKKKKKKSSGSGRRKKTSSSSKSSARRKR